MARALQCPSCGTKTRLDGVASDTFNCQQCGQVLKVPPSARRPSGPSPARPAAGDGPPPPPRRPVPSEATVATSDPPRRDAPPPPAPNPPVVVAGGGTAVLGPSESGAAPPRTPRRGRGAKPSRDALPVAVRIGAWVLAVPIGLVLVGIPARILGFLTSQKLLDVFVKHTLARFVPLAVIVVLWALATTVLVELFIEGGRWLMLRRRGGPGGPAASGPDPAPAAPPPRARRSTVRAPGS